MPAFNARRRRRDIMSWKYEDSLDRIQTHLDGMSDIEIEDLVREADLKVVS
jgi:hypothetical protein